MTQRRVRQGAIGHRRPGNKHVTREKRTYQGPGIALGGRADAPVRARVITRRFDIPPALSLSDFRPPSSAPPAQSSLLFLRTYRTLIDKTAQTGCQAVWCRASFSCGLRASNSGGVMRDRSDSQHLKQRAFVVRANGAVIAPCPPRLIVICNFRPAQGLYGARAQSDDGALQ